MSKLPMLPTTWPSGRTIARATHELSARILAQCSSCATRSREGNAAIAAAAGSACCSKKTAMSSGSTRRSTRVRDPLTSRTLLPQLPAQLGGSRWRPVGVDRALEWPALGEPARHRGVQRAIQLGDVSAHPRVDLRIAAVLGGVDVQA